MRFERRVAYNGKRVYLQLLIALLQAYNCFFCSFVLNTDILPLTMFKKDCDAFRPERQPRLLPIVDHCYKLTPRPQEHVRLHSSKQ